MVVKKVTQNIVKGALNMSLKEWIAWIIKGVLIFCTVWLFNTVKMIPSTIKYIKALPQTEARIKALEQVNHDKHIMDSVRKALRERTDENKRERRK